MSRKRPCRIVSVNEMQFGFIRKKRGTDAAYFVKAARMH